MTTLYMIPCKQSTYTIRFTILLCKAPSSFTYKNFETMFTD